MTLNAHATPKAAGILFRRKRHSGRGDRSEVFPTRAFRHRGYSPVKTQFGVSSDEIGLDLLGLFGGNSGPGQVLLAKGGLLAEEPLRSEGRLATALDDEDEDEEEDVDDEGDDLDEDDEEDLEDEEEDFDDEDEDDLDEDEDEYLDDEEEEDEEEE